MVTTTLWTMDPRAHNAVSHAPAPSTPAPRPRGQGRRWRLLTAALALPLALLNLTPGRSVAAPAQNITFAMKAAQATCLQYA